MRVAVVHFHPVPESFSASVLAAVRAGLDEAGHDIAVYRLHDGDDPGPDELAGVEALVIVYPTWWGGQPAALLNWIQRRLGPWIDGRPGTLSPLGRVRHLVAVTTHGSSQLVNRVQGEPGRRLFERVLPSLCADDVEVRWLSRYKLDRTSEAQRREFLAEIPAAVGLGSPTAESAPDP